MNVVAFLAPLFLIFEVWQLVMSERYLGIKQIARGADPRSLGMHELTAFAWSSMLFLYWAWMLLLLFSPVGGVNAMALIGVSLVGYAARRGVPHKWVLVTMTLEGAVRIGFLVSLLGLLWWKYR